MRFTYFTGDSRQGTTVNRFGQLCTRGCNREGKCIVGCMSLTWKDIDNLCPHTNCWCHTVYCGGWAEVQCLSTSSGRTMVCVLYVLIITVGVMLCIVGDGQRFSVSLDKFRLDHGLCVVRPHNYCWCQCISMSNLKTITKYMTYICIGFAI